MSDIQEDHAFRLGLVIDGKLDTITKGLDGDIYIREDGDIYQQFSTNEDFFDFLNLFCLARGEMEKQND